MVGLHGRILSWYRRPQLRRIPTDPARACRHPASVTCHQHARGCRAPAGTTRIPSDYAPYFRPPVLVLPPVRDGEVVHPGAVGLGPLVGALDRAAVVAEGAREALREGRIVAPDPQYAVLERDVVDARDAARVEVVLDDLLT